MNELIDTAVMFYAIYFSTGMGAYVNVQYCQAVARS